MIYGKTKSCGCLRRETVKNLNKNKKTHGERYTRLYRIWIGMKSRCFNKNNHAYSHYGQREIVVCDEWKNDYLCFKNWAMDNGYTDGLTIDRIDVNGNYEPSNCRWITYLEQENNRTNNNLITYKNKTKTISEWARETGINKNTIWARLFRYGWSVEKALSTDYKFFKSEEEARDYIKGLDK